MQAAAITSRFLTGCSSNAGFAGSEIAASHSGLLGYIFASHLTLTAHSRALFLELINALIQSAERAYAARDLDALEDASRILTNLPTDDARQIGLYYRALAIKRRGGVDEAQTLLQTVADNAPLAYRARAMQGLGANCHDKGQLDEAFRFQLEALRAAGDKNAHGLQTKLMAHGEIAIVRSLGGDHKGALSDLERLWPLVSRVARQNPFYFYLYHNELAVELGEAGRLEEARAACEIALASPFAGAYPEWSETGDEIAAKRVAALPSVVTINRTHETERSHIAERAARIRRATKAKRARVPTTNRLACRNSFIQRASVTIAAKAPIVRHVVTHIADQILICCGPRAPPRA